MDINLELTLEEVNTVLESLENKKNAIATLSGKIHAQANTQLTVTAPEKTIKNEGETNNE